MAAAFMCFSCTNTATNPQNASNTNPGDRTWSGDQLENSGQATTGQQLRTVDSSVGRR